MVVRLIQHIVTSLFLMEWNRRAKRVLYVVKVTIAC